MQHNRSVTDLQAASQADAALTAQLAAEENVLCTLAVDLDNQLRFSPGQLVLTDRRLMTQSGTDAWQEWPLRGPDLPAPPGLALRHFDHAGVGTLELVDTSGAEPRRL